MSAADKPNADASAWDKRQWHINLMARSRGYARTVYNLSRAPRNVK